MGVRPTWDQASRRVTGFEIISRRGAGAAKGRRDAAASPASSADAFPAQIELFDAAARAVMALDEAAEQNPGRRPPA